MARLAKAVTDVLNAVRDGNASKGTDEVTTGSTTVVKNMGDTARNVVKEVRQAAKDARDAAKDRRCRRRRVTASAAGCADTAAARWKRAHHDQQQQ